MMGSSRPGGRTACARQGSPPAPTPSFSAGQAEQLELAVIGVAGALVAHPADRHVGRGAPRAAARPRPSGAPRSRASAARRAGRGRPRRATAPTRAGPGRPARGPGAPARARPGGRASRCRRAPRRRWRPARRRSPARSRAAAAPARRDADARGVVVGARRRRGAVGVRHHDRAGRWPDVSSAPITLRERPAAGHVERLHGDPQAGARKVRAHQAVRACLGGARRRARAPRGDAHGDVVRDRRGEQGAEHRRRLRVRPSREHR